MKISVILISIIFFSTVSFSQEIYNEQYRPQIHFSPKAHWMNDPNGMVYNNGVYHLFFQHYPNGTVWGPMHWGHATSTDIIHWKEQSIALYPDSIGYIFSGSIVIDKNNTSGFGKNGEVPMVAIFTQHDPAGEKKGSDIFQTQSIAYSLDNGTTWIKYKNNPVLKNPGIKDYRDPKVMWYEDEHKWVMTLATKSCITFYSSKNLKEWKKESEFGKKLGAHGGVWECPDLFYLYDDHGKKVWILLVSINPGGPNEGSGTQYFTGNFDGHIFSTSQKNVKWVDYGCDNYAGVTWSNTGNRKIFLGWMSNWLYANIVPTQSWRGANTIPRELSLINQNGDYYVAMEPVKEIEKLNTSTQDFANEINKHSGSLKKEISVPFQLHIKGGELKTFSIKLLNNLGENVVIGYDQKDKMYYVDRSHSGKTDFDKNFTDKIKAPLVSSADEMDINLIVDKASFELFADKGLSVMTNIFFPNKPFDKIQIVTSDSVIIKELKYSQFKSIWNGRQGQDL